MNPLLAKNMGRWAQVYFTSPPEKREQAVQDLLRDLEAESTGREIATDPIPGPSQAPVVARTLEPWPLSSRLNSQPQAASGHCSACGRDNPESQKFCGMCGARLGDDSSAADPPREAIHGEGLRLSDLQITDEHRLDDLGQIEAPDFGQSDESYFAPRNHERELYQRPLNNDGLSLFQSTSNVDYYNDEDSGQIFSVPPPSRSYRIWVGLILAVVIGVLSYMAWRSTQQTSQTSHVESVAPPPIPNEPASSANPSSSAPPAPPASTPASTPSSSVPEKGATDRSATPSNPPSAAAGNPKHDTVRKPVETAARPRQNVPVPEKAAQAVSSSAGAEELAMAQRYLNGTGGQGRNSAEGAKWLWRAVAKHNADATLLLSDLYLRGDGVSKNCDQARVLLDTAALKGVKDAGQRLRHLQAFGCQ